MLLVKQINKPLNIKRRSFPFEWQLQRLRRRKPSGFWVLNSIFFNQLFSFWHVGLHGFLLWEPWKEKNRSSRWRMCWREPRWVPESFTHFKSQHTFLEVPGLPFCFALDIQQHWTPCREKGIFSSLHFLSALLWDLRIPSPSFPSFPFPSSLLPQELVLAGLGTLRDAGLPTWVSCMQDKCLTYSLCYWFGSQFFFFKKKKKT